jgi:hypothetical protein
VIIAPLLLLMFFGIITLARAWHVHNVMDHAAREAARFGATSVPFDDAETFSVAAGILSSSAIDPGQVQSCLARSEGSAVCSGIELGAFTEVPHVEVVLTLPDYELDFIFFSMSPTITATAVARYEG